MGHWKKENGIDSCYEERNVLSRGLDASLGVKNNFVEVSKLRIQIGIEPKMLDPDPDEMNADPQPWSKAVLQIRFRINRESRIWIRIKRKSQS